jgi:O-antigen/teichoic acid export membrane protein
VTTNTSARIKLFMSGLDVSFFKGSVAISIGTILGRGFGFLGSLLLARFFNPADYGVIQYAISLAMIIASGVQPLGQHVIARYVGMSQDRSEELQEFLSNIWFIIAVIFSITIFIAIPLLLITKNFNVGILAIFFSVSAFYIYLGLARGNLALGRYIIADAGSSVAKVVMILALIWALDMKSTVLAMFIHGISFIIPLILLQIIQPFKITFDKNLISKPVTKGILKFSLPIWLSHASYMFYNVVPLLFLEHYADDTAVGIFSLAASLSMIFSFLSMGFSTILMPKIAGTSGQRHKMLLYSALGMTMLGNFALLLVYYFLVPWLVKTFFGGEYLMYPEIFFMWGIVSILTGVQGIITSVFVGEGRAQEETKSRLVTVIVAVFACWFLVPTSGALGAAWAMLIGVVFGLMVFGLIYIGDHFRSDRNKSTKEWIKL